MKTNKDLLLGLSDYPSGLLLNSLPPGSTFRQYKRKLRKVRKDSRRLGLDLVSTLKRHASRGINNYKHDVVMIHGVGVGDLPLTVNFLFGIKEAKEDYVSCEAWAAYITTDSHISTSNVRYQCRPLPAFMSDADQGLLRELKEWSVAASLEAFYKKPALLRGLLEFDGQRFRLPFSSRVVPAEVAFNNPSLSYTADDLFAKASADHDELAGRIERMRNQLRSKAHSSPSVGFSHYYEKTVNYKLNRMAWSHKAFSVILDKLRTQYSMMKSTSKSL